MNKDRVNKSDDHLTMQQAEDQGLSFVNPFAELEPVPVGPQHLVLPPALDLDELYEPTTLSNPEALDLAASLTSHAGSKPNVPVNVDALIEAIIERREGSA